MTVYEVVHIAVVPLAIRNHVLEIEFSRYILFSSEVGQVLLLFKKREDFLICSFISIYLLMNLYLSKFFPYYKREHQKCYLFPYLDSRCLLINPIYQQDTRLIQQPHRQRNQRERKHVRSRRDDGCHYENNYDGMFPIAAHEVGREETQFGKQPG